ncbi:MAG: hypothetical protein FWG66_10040 [Spirochaetes bacterium]|nr:hypothetical protein [Spirochaetota bacterium]
MMKKVRFAFALMCVLPVLASCQSQEVAVQGAAQEQGAWRDAYSGLLTDMAAGFTDQWGNVSAYFLLHDMGGTGVPSLVVLEDVQGVARRPLAAYTFAGGSLQTIELGDMPSYILSTIYAPPGDSGLIAVSIGGDTGGVVWLELEGAAFRRRTAGWYEFRQEEPSDFFSPVRFFFYIDGQPVSEAEFNGVFPAGMKWRGKALCGE